MELKNLSEYYRKVMTKALAEDIKQWRVVEECSWRKVHEKYQEKYLPQDKWSISEEMVKHFGMVPYGKQYEGALLCEIAMNFLNEDGWNE